jgi:murein DD-endopeptidase MepM/ murein hydrolase activator NlpD
MNILEVILTEVTIYQDTKWEKKGLDWNELPDAVSRLNNTPNTTVVLAKIKADLDAWRKANPRGTIEQAWTYLGGKGPAPEPVKEMPARDLKVEPPEDNAGWIDFGDKWQNTKMTPTGFAFKPNPDKPNTWGPNWIPAKDAIKKIKNDKNNKNISDQDVDKKLRALTSSTGAQKYSEKEIADAWETIKHHDALDKAEQEAELPPDPITNANGTITCPDGWKYDPTNKICVKNSATANQEPNNEPPKPIEKDGKMTCEPSSLWEYDPATKTCKKKAVTNTNTEEAGIIFPAGNLSLVNKTNPYGSKGGKHRGIDIGVGYGTKVVAPESGEVIKVDIEYATDKKTKKEIRAGGGLYVVFKSKDGKRVHKFMHLSDHKGEGSYSQGQEIANSGGEPRADGDISAKDDLRPGNADGNHLHWEVWVDGVPVDPLTLPQLKK